MAVAAAVLVVGGMLESSKVVTGKAGLHEFHRGLDSSAAPCTRHQWRRYATVAPPAVSHRKSWLLSKRRNSKGIVGREMSTTKGLGETSSIRSMYVICFAWALGGRSFAQQISLDASTVFAACAKCLLISAVRIGIPI